MQALEWWPTTTAPNGITNPRIFVNGPCSHCGANTTREDHPYRPTIGSIARNVAPLYCGPNHARAAYAKRHRETSVNDPGQITLAQNTGRAIAKQWQKKNHGKAKRLLNAIPTQYQEIALRVAANTIAAANERREQAAARDEARPLKGHALPRPKTLTQTHDQRIATYRATRAQISKSSKPILEEARRRRACPLHSKVAYHNDDTGWEAANWHLNELRNGDGVYATIYLCDPGCGYLHVSGGAR